MRRELWLVTSDSENICDSMRVFACVQDNSKYVDDICRVDILWDWNENINLNF